MKQSPFKFQGNNSAEAKKSKSKDAKNPEDKSGKSALPNQNVSKAQSHSKFHTPVRSGRAKTGGGRPKAGG